MKYRLTDETMQWEGHTLHRIEALKDFMNLKAGDKGGWIESEENLSQDDNCWVYNEAKVFDDALVLQNAKVYGNATMFDLSQVCDDAKIYKNAKVYGSAIVCGSAEVYGNSRVYSNTEVYGHASVFGNAKIYGRSCISGNARVYGSADVHGCVDVRGDAEVCGCVDILSNRDYIVFKNWWSSGRYFTWTRSNNMWKVGCFYGTGEELIAKAYKDSEESGREYERIVRYVESILKEKKV